TCFGAILEVAYELKTTTPSWFIGSEGITPANGWDYTTLFNIFLNGSLSSSAFCDSALNQFSTQYSGVPNSTISKIDLSKVGALQLSFESFAATLASTITTSTIRDSVRSTIMTTVKSYCFPSGQSDMYIDIYDFAEKMKNTVPTSAAAVQAAVNAAVVSSWSREDGDTSRKIGIYYSPLLQPGVVNPPHHIDYTKGSLSMSQSRFVTDSTNWVPNSVPKSTSFLDKIFYCSAW
ncbi:MAG TPA: clostripain-related cysteine peptidase, partial [Treponemataceae bacterium]|nr:clostripain-related cysteine peptidase [Treponemataceae bacterium]